MNRTLLSIFALCLLPFHVCCAQNTAKWAVGPDLFAVLNKNVVPKYNLFVLYKIGEHGALRLRGGFQFLEIDRQYIVYDYNDEKAYTFRIGYERTKALYKQSLFMHYGAEYVYLHDHIHRYEFNSPLPVVAPTAVRYSQNGGSAFIGCRYFILPALSVSMEAACQVTKSDVERVIPEFQVVLVSFNTVSLHPVNSLNLCFHF